jgi:hypothetical protein
MRYLIQIPSVGFISYNSSDDKATIVPTTARATSFSDKDEALAVGEVYVNGRGLEFILVSYRAY